MSLSDWLGSRTITRLHGGLVLSHLLTQATLLLSTCLGVQLKMLPRRTVAAQLVCGEGKWPSR